MLLCAHIIIILFLWFLRIIRINRSFRADLFNCGEGTQRFCTEHKVRLAKVQHIFFSQLTWDLIGGLPGKFFSTISIF